jgi:hypothetical protein
MLMSVRVVTLKTSSRLVEKRSGQGITRGTEHGSDRKRQKDVFCMLEMPRQMDGEYLPLETCCFMIRTTYVHNNVFLYVLKEPYIWNLISLS